MVAILGTAAEAAKQTFTPNFFAETAWVIPVLSLLAAVLIIFFGRRMPKKGPEVGILLTAAGLVWSVGVLLNYVGRVGGPEVEESIRWFSIGPFSFEAGMLVSGLTAVMFVLVTFVSLMVQIYSTSYMHDDKRYTWYFGVINLFTASMLNLVIANNLLQMLLGWELVGVCSYLLIGHWWEEHPNSSAAIKAFITTRTGDVPFMIGIFVLFGAAGTMNINEIVHLAHEHQIAAGTALAASLLLFGGAMGKSAQFPLHVWLPDAMAGPTPASSLIHAATMVTAGVFMIARLFPVFEAAGGAALNVVAIIAAITMLGAALLAMVQDDVKKVLAYSTVSQLAYMFAALGVGAGNAAIFHLFTHGFFKALLFMAAGSLIHAVHSNNMSDMGGLKKIMPTTYWTFLVGTLALSGIPPFAGFFSKDEILTEAFTNPESFNSIVTWIVYGTGVVTAFLTAFYMSRALHLVFEGKYRGHGHPHESPKLMTTPLVILAAMSAVVGFAGFPGWHNGFAAWVGVGGNTHVPAPQYFLIGASILIAAAGLALGRKVYMPAPASEPLKRMGWFYKVLVNKYYLDDLYWKAIVKPIRDSVSAALYWLNQHVFDGAVNGAAAAARATGRGLYGVVDQKVIDGAVNGVGIGAKKTAGVRKVMQSGDVQKYAAALFGGVAIFALLFAVVFNRIG